MRFFLDNTLNNISDINSLKIFLIFGLNQPKKGLHLEWNRFFRKKYFPVFLLVLWYLQKWSTFLLCIFNELIGNFSTFFRTITAESICLYSLLSWFVSFFNKRSAVFNWHMCRNYKFQSLNSRRPTSLTHENDPRVWSTRMTHETHVTTMNGRMLHSSTFHTFDRGYKYVCFRLSFLSTN